MPAPPVVPPKPRGYTPVEELEQDESSSRLDEEEDEENEDPYAALDGTMGRERSVLPAALRATSPDTENPRVAKHTGQSTTAKIEPDLVAKGR